MIAKRSASPDIVSLTQQMLEHAVVAGASDIHIEPGEPVYTVRYRVDGLLQTAMTHPAETGRGLVNRLMVLASLLTYRQDIPQEGRASVLVEAAGRVLDLRLAIIPAAQGLRAAIRLPAELHQPKKLQLLDLPRAVLAALLDFAIADAGLLLITGPAGSGKTTTIYALLEHILSTQPGLSIVALEDPIERILPGVTQVQVQPQGELTYERALRSILRQDPQVLMLGEIRDDKTASIAIQAALSGHRLIATLHAADPGSAMSRLLEMGLAPYQLTGSLWGVVTQRLLRRSAGDGYHGRFPVGEVATLDDDLRRAILGGDDARAIQALIAARPGHQTLAQSAQAAIDAGLTDHLEAQRVLGARFVATAGAPEPRSFHRAQ